MYRNGPRRFLSRSGGNGEGTVIITSNTILWDSNDLDEILWDANPLDFLLWS